MNLNQLRKQIDEIDRKILGLINQRGKIAKEIGKIKTRDARDYLVPGREQQVLERIEAINKGPLPTKSLRAIYREIMSASIAIQSPMRIIYLGPEASFTHAAALKQFGSSPEFVPGHGIPEIFAAVEKGNVDYGVVPVENSTGGVITHTLDMFIESDARIWAEIMLPIKLCLLTNAAADTPRVVYSHWQGFEQSKSWLEKNLPDAEKKTVFSTSEAARLAAADKEGGAVAGKIAAKLYNLNVQAEGIEDMRELNFTRFLAISKNSPERSSRDKTSVMFSIKDRVGALYDMLKSFKKHSINLTRIESRPSRKKAWDYFFFVDMLGHQDDATVSRALEEIEKESVYLKILGSYPAGGRAEDL